MIERDRRPFFVMKKILLVFCLVLAAAFGTKAQSAAASETRNAPLDTLAAAPVLTPVGPSIEFKEQSFDFGTIKQGEVVEHIFLLRNNGTLPLIISDVRTTCGCTATDFPKAPIMPGEVKSITAKFNSAGKRGAQRKVITVESNAIQGKTQVLILTQVQATN